MANKNFKRGSRKGTRRDDTAELMPRGVVWKPSSGSSGILNHKFRVQGTIYAIAGTGFTILAGAPIRFNLLPNNSAYLALFDQYRIDTVEVTFMLKGTTGAAMDFPRVTLFPDFDDASAPPTLTAAQSHPRAKIVSLTPARPNVSMTFEPRLALAAYRGAFSGYASSAGPVFVDSATADVDHYGFKYAIENLAVGQEVDVIYRVWFTMRNPL